MEPSLATAQAVSPDMLVFVGLGFVLLLVLVLSQSSSRDRRRQSPPSTKAPSGPPKPTNFRPVSGKPWSPEVQMQAIAKVEFERQRALNKEEARVLYALESICEKLGNDFRLLIQPSLGELLKPKAHFNSVSGKKAYSAINAKRLDFGIIDRFGYLVAAIEYQGSGHYRQTSFMRDAVKREALRKAGVDLIEVKKGETPTDLERRVRASVSKFFPGPEAKNA